MPRPHRPRSSPSRSGEARLAFPRPVAVQLERDGDAPTTVAHLLVPGDEEGRVDLAAAHLELMRVGLLPRHAPGLEPRYARDGVPTVRLGPAGTLRLHAAPPDTQNDTQPTPDDAYDAPLIRPLRPGRPLTHLPVRARRERTTPCPDS